MNYTDIQITHALLASPFLIHLYTVGVGAGLFGGWLGGIVIAAGREMGERTWQWLRARPRNDI